ncbi:reticulocalbin-1 [Macadamia integrifolia]|uniref:reticulocalbin-1 n=1 Tax=Macadamia integrifolia TaxID=60698 RepID=UPI001C4F2D7C|nr:reticulocalbin-1 [Macadamia integrifolia]
MKLAVVGYLMVAATVVVFLTLSPTSRRLGRHLHGGRRLGHKHAPFDPLVGKMERRMEEERSGGSTDENHHPMSSSSTTSWDNSTVDLSSDDTKEEEGEEEYFKDIKGKLRLNITMRLLTMFPLIDKDPKDGFISLKELEIWNVERAVERLNYKTLKEMRRRDEDGDGSLSLFECLHQFSLKNLESNDMTPGQVGWWKEQFNNADVDGNGFLDLHELNDFLNPKDSENEEIQVWLLREKIRYMDDDRDGKLNFVEFHDHAYDIYKNHAEYEYHKKDIPKPEQKFAELDLNFDKFLTAEELLPILHQLYPGEITYATYYAKFLIHEVDGDKDGKLTINEMLNHEEIFYSKVFEEEFDNSDDDDDEYYDYDDYDDDDDFRDEF